MDLKKELLKFDKTYDEKQRLDFVDKWAKYVRTHDDKKWSRLINPIINSELKEANRVKKKFYGIK